MAPYLWGAIRGLPLCPSTYQNPSLGVDIIIAPVSQKGTLRHSEVRSLVQAFTAVNCQPGSSSPRCPPLL